MKNKITTKHALSTFINCGEEPEVLKKTDKFSTQPSFFKPNKMTVKRLQEYLETMPLDGVVKIMESEKHSDNAPLMDIINIEETEFEDGGAVLIVIEPNPQTVINSSSEDKKTIYRLEEEIKGWEYERDALKAKIKILTKRKTTK